MKRSSLQEADYLIAWVLFFLCATVGSAIVGFIGGGIIGAVLGISGAKTQVIRAAGAVVGFVLSMPVSYIVFRLIVAKFIVAKVEAQLSNPAPIPQNYTPPTQQAA